jgi:O-antigen ligase
MSPLDVSPAQWGRSWTAKAFVVAVGLTVLAYGSAADPPLYIASIAFATLAGFSLFHAIGSVAVGRIYAATVLLLAILLSYVALQTLPHVAGDLANAAWRSVDELVGDAPATISAAPGMTLAAMPRLALPFLVFLAALALFQGDAGAMALWRALAYFGAGLAVYGILQDVLLPEQLLFVRKKFYIGSLTASFVNRNTAGTFFGVALLLNLGLAFYYLRKVRVRSLARTAMAMDLRWRDKNTLLLLHALACLTIAVALFLTQSRGAVGATFVGTVVGVLLMTMRSLTADEPSGRLGAWRRYATFLAGFVLVVGMFALFAGRSIYRMEEQGSDDARWCAFASTIQAIRDHPILGTGFGAFQDVFPAYRNAECVGIFGVWDRAHDFFLEGYLGLGLPFAFALLVGYAILVGVCLRGLRSRHRYRFVSVMGLAALVLATTHSIVDFSLQIPGVAVYFAAAMAATTTMSLGGGGQARASRA